MRSYIIILLFACLAICGSTHASVYNRLCEINKYWKEQKDIDTDKLPLTTPSTGDGLIRLHLSLVEQILRSRDNSHLTPGQRQNRNIALNHLHTYWLKGAFPQNEDYPVRTPVFIDKHDNFCAVGYLLKATGHEDVSRMIATRSNLGYVHEMNYPELFAWAGEYGFTVDELAWIQPTYSPLQFVASMGEGTNGTVYELYSDDSAGRLYAGGSFSKADDTLPAQNIAYITENNGIFTWHSMGANFNGPVYAIASFDNKIFAGGDFTLAGNGNATSVAYWDGNAWQGAGPSCMKGVIKDLVIYHGKLYAAGKFNAYPGVQASLAQWTGTCWYAFTGITGIVNTAEVYNDKLVLGGDFSFNGNPLNVIAWDDVSSFQPFANAVPDIVNDLEIYKNQLFAACSGISPNSQMLKKLQSGTWINDSINIYNFYSTPPAIYTILTYDDTLLAAGGFRTYISGGIEVYNSITLKPPPPQFTSYRNWFMVDSTIYKLAKFKNYIIAGGIFKGGNYFDLTPLNSIARKSYCINYIAQFTWKKQPDSSVAFVFNNILFPHNPPDSIQWFFGDGDSTTTYAPDSTIAHAYKSPGSYYACALVYTACGADKACDTVLIPTGVSEPDEPGIKFYPNPAQRFFVIEGATQGTRADLLDMTGRQVGSWILPGRKASLDISAYENGCYLLQLTTQHGERKLLKLIKE